MGWDPLEVSGGRYPLEADGEGIGAGWQSLETGSEDEDWARTGLHRASNRGAGTGLEQDSARPLTEEQELDLGTDSTGPQTEE